MSTPVNAIPQPLLDSLAALGQAVADQGTLVAALRDQIKTNMTPAEVAQVQAAIDTVVGNLKGIQIDPDAPVPVQLKKK